MHNIFLNYEMPTKQLKKTAGSRVVSVGDLVLVHDETHPRSYWKMSKVERLLMSQDRQSQSPREGIKRRWTLKEIATVVVPTGSKLFYK